MRPVRLGAQRLALGLTVAAASFPAAALASGPPSPERLQSVVDLAYVLGEAHAFHRACAGAEDDTWRSRMSRLIQVEDPDPRHRDRLMASFNAGFVAGGAAFPTCVPATEQAERKVAEEGRRLSLRLASSP